MRWNKPGKFRAALAAVFPLLCALLLSPADPERQLSVYTPQKTYAVEVQDRQGQLYINITDLLGPLGAVDIHRDGKDWKLRFNGVDGAFSEGSDSARLRGKSVDLGGKTLVETNHVLVPMGASFAIISALLKAPVELHQSGRRLFIENTTTRFTAELKKSDKSSLLLNFDHPVNPAIIQEDGKIRLTFKREPVVSNITNQPWDDKTIHSISFSEDNGAASLTVTGVSGLMASLSGDGRNIIIEAAAPTTAAAQPVASLPAATPPATSPLPPAAAAPQTPAETGETHAAPAFFVMIDPGHGGSDPGARLGDKVLEKDVTLALARRLKAELQERGVAARILRDGDTGLTLDQRAEITNGQHAALYVALHAGMPGPGVRVYCSGGTTTAVASGKFLLWDNAQANYLARSQTLAKEVAGGLAKRNLRVSSLSTPLRPLNNINAPAIAVEIAPGSDSVQDVMGQKFQTTVASGIASEIAQTRSRWEKQP